MTAILGSVSSALPYRKLDTLSKLQKAKQSALESKNRMMCIDLSTSQFLVQVKSTRLSRGLARMLTKAEIKELRQTKHSIAEHVMHAFKQAA